MALLEIKNLHAEVAGGGRKILKGVDLAIDLGEIHAIMGKNGSGKSTLCQVLAGREVYTVTQGTVRFGGKDLLAMAPEERAREGMFLGFQYPVEIPGVSTSYFLKAAVNEIRKHRGEPELNAAQFLKLVQEKMDMLGMDKTFMNRAINEGFSGGEKKRNEVFQMAVVNPLLALLDETDSGLDIDALKTVAAGVNKIHQSDKKKAILLVTHYQRLLNYIVPDKVHVMIEGRIVKSGGKELALALEEKGYDWVEEEIAAGAGELNITSGRQSAEASKMAGVLEETNSFVEAFDRTPGHALPWVNELRARGMATFRRLGFPTTSQEEWRDTNVTILAKTAFTPARMIGGKAAMDLAQAHTLGDAAAAELVFVNGHFEPHLSTMSNLPKGVRALSLEQAFESDRTLLEDHLGTAAMERHPFAALNTSFVREGAVVHLAKEAVCELPIHLLFLTVPQRVSAKETLDAEAPASQPRVLVVADDHAEASIVETYAGGTGAEFYLTDGVTEMYLGKGAKIDHNKLQQEGPGGYHVALQQVVLEAGSLFVSHSTSLGSKLTRNDLEVIFAGEGAEATLNGLVLTGGEQHIDNHTLLRHNKPHCASHELYKHVLDAKAMAVFRGKIFVEKDAQKTDSKQTSKSLLLTDTCYMESQPVLEIHADDVKCTHGSTTGPVDENAVFYLVSRGLSLPQARHLMTYAFAADITRRIRVAPVRARIEDFMARQHGLPQDLRITDEARHDVALL